MKWQSALLASTASADPCPVTISFFAVFKFWLVYVDSRGGMGMWSGSEQATLLKAGLALNNRVWLVTVYTSSQ